VLDFLNEIIDNELYFAAVMISMAVLLLPALFKKLDDRKVLISGFVAHLAFQLIDLDPDTPYKSYVFALSIDFLIYLLCLVICERGMILTIGLLSLTCAAINIFQLSSLIVYDGVITSPEFKDFLYKTQPYILIITFIQTLLLAYDTYGRELIRGFSTLLSNRMVVFSGRKQSNKVYTETQG